MKSLLFALAGIACATTAFAQDIEYRVFSSESELVTKGTLDRVSPVERQKLLAQYERVKRPIQDRPISEGPVLEPAVRDICETLRNVLVRHLKHDRGGTYLGDAYLESYDSVRLKLDYGSPLITCGITWIGGGGGGTGGGGGDTAAGKADDQANMQAIVRVGCVDHSPEYVNQDDNGDQPADYCQD